MTRLSTLCVLLLALSAAAGCGADKKIVKKAKAAPARRLTPAEISFRQGHQAAAGGDWLAAAQAFDKAAKLDPHSGLLNRKLKLFREKRAEKKKQAEEKQPAEAEQQAEEKSADGQ